jgi:EAL and modified HD-GYP domain-containing signal transduction protein
MLGEREIRKWIALVSLTSMGSDRPLDLAVKSVTRGRMCELVSEPTGASKRSADLFILGVLAHLDALVSRPMEEVLAEVNLPRRRPGRPSPGGRGNPPRLRLAIAESYEPADWNRVSAICERPQVPERAVPAAYLEAVSFRSDLLPQEGFVDGTQLEVVVYSFGGTPDLVVGQIPHRSRRGPHRRHPRRDAPARR